MDLIKQKIAFAKSCGWTLAKNEFGQEVILTPQGSELWHYDSRGNSYGPASRWDSQITQKALPDYLNDLNIIIKEVSKLTIKEKIEFAFQMSFIRKTSWPCYERSAVELMTADPSQWCEAYLKTKKLWEE